VDGVFCEHGFSNGLSDGPWLPPLDVRCITINGALRAYEFLQLEDVKEKYCMAIMVMAVLAAHAAQLPMLCRWVLKGHAGDIR